MLCVVDADGDCYEYISVCVISVGALGVWLIHIVII